MEPTEMLKALGDPFPRNAVKQREGAGRKRFDYIETHTVIHRLNSVAGAWDFRIVNIEWRADLLMVQGELTIPGLGTRSGFGVQKVAVDAGEDLVKGASSDALKKCATLFGVALDLYGPDYEATSAPMRPQRDSDTSDTAKPAQDLPRQATQRGQSNDEENERRQTLIGRAHAKVSHEALHNWALSEGFDSVANVTIEKLATLLNAINKTVGLDAFNAKFGESQPLEIDGMDELNAAADLVQKLTRMTN